MTSSPYTEDLPGTLTMRAGQVLRIRLTGAGGAGNRWTCQVAGTAVLASVAVTPPTVPAGPTPDSSSAAEALVVTGQEPGTAEVRLRLGRAWSPDALAEHHLRVTVH